MEECGRFGVVG